MREWPDAAAYKATQSWNDEYSLDLQYRAAAYDAAMERLRVAVEALREYADDYNSATHALTRIGPLPPLPPPPSTGSGG